MQHIAEMEIRRVARAQAPVEVDPEVSRALAQVLEHGGDLGLALIGLVPERAEYFGPGKRFLQALVDQTFDALLGEEELIERLEAQRRSVLGQVVAGGVTVAATLISTVSGLQVAAAAVVFLYLVPIGVRAAYDTWKARQEGDG